MSDVEEKYYADGEDAYDMRKPFKQLKPKAAPVKQLQPAPAQATDTERGTGASEQNDDTQAGAAAPQDKLVHGQTENSITGAQNGSTDKGGSQQAKTSHSKSKGARSKKR